MRTPLLAIHSSLLASLFVAGCGSVSGEDTGASRDAVTSRKGVDYSWARPSPHALHAAGYTFAARYLSYDTTGKNLSASEARALVAAGLDIVSNWEQDAAAALNGYSQGVSDAQTADSQAAADGMPAGRPIYFSVDFDASPGDQAAIDAYFDGVASVIGRSRTGAYGGFYVIERLFNAGKIKWGWQTYAWSGGQWDSRAQLRQVQNDIVIPGACDPGSCDEDEAVAIDFGQWGHSTPPQGPPTPVPATPSGCGTIDPGQGLTPGETFSSCDGRFDLAMQNDGNLVLYMGTHPLWATGTTNGYVAVMQNDGNFVLYGKHSDAQWSSHTNGHAGAKLVVQDDGNLVVYAPDGHALWSTGTSASGGGSANGKGSASGKCSASELANATDKGINWWTCQGNARYICDDQQNKIVESCPTGCAPAGIDNDDQCRGGGQPQCTSQEVSNQRGTVGGLAASFWTCEGSARYVCDVRGNKVAESCSNGCAPQGVGVDDLCN